MSVAECADIDSTKDKKTFAELKSIQSKQDETARLAWHFSPHRYPRTYVFAGSANEEQIVNDPTGGRRFWIMTPNFATEANRPLVINTEWLRENRDQLLGEIIVAYGLLPLLEEATAGVAKWDNGYFDTALVIPEALRPWHDQNEKYHAYALQGEEIYTEEALLGKIPDFDPKIGATTSEIYAFVLCDVASQEPRDAARTWLEARKYGKSHAALTAAMKRNGYEKRDTNIRSLPASRTTGHASRWVRMKDAVERPVPAGEGPDDFDIPKFQTAAERAAEQIDYDDLPF